MGAPARHPSSWLWALAAVLIFSLALLWPRTAWSQIADVELDASTSAGLVEVGESFHITLKVLSTRSIRATNPQLRIPVGMSASAPRVAPALIMHWGGGGSMVKRGINATWRVVAKKVGMFNIAPPTVVVDGQITTAGNTMRVKVVAAGQKPKADPLDPFSNFPTPFSKLFKDLRRRRAPNELFIDEDVKSYDDIGPLGRKLMLRSAPDEYLFLRLVPSKKQLVVGEQLTLSWYVYFRVSHKGGIDHEPPMPDFMRIALESAPGVVTDKVVTSVAGKVWFARRVNQTAVFPLRAGNLRTGVFSGEYRVPYLRNRTINRSSNDVQVLVHEPPREGRPPGYRMGDVGRFRLQAKVDPRQTEVGESVSVQVTVEGRGALPNALRVPQRAGVEWLTPEKRDDINVQRGKVGGWRRFGYAVRLVDEGMVDLGIVKLPYYDPVLRRYRVARVRLGEVRVNKRRDGTKAVDLASDDGDRDTPFKTLAKPRTSMQPYAPSSRRPLAARTFWGLVLAPPLAILLLGAGVQGWGALRRRRRERKQDPATLAWRALAEAKRADDPKDTAAAAERALHLAIEAATSIKSRAVLLADLPDELEDRGVEPSLAEQVCEAFEACSSLRFDPTADEEHSSALIKRNKRLVKRLLRVRSSGPEEED